MCNLYTYKMSAEDMRLLKEHYRLVDISLEEILRGRNTPTDVYPNYEAPVMSVVNGKPAAELMRWAMPGPVFPPQPGEKPKPPGRITNVRNTASGHWKPWLAATNVVVGKDKNLGGRCIVPAKLFAEPDRNTSKPVLNRWFGRADGLPFFFAGIWREWTGDRGTIKEPNVGKHRLYAFLTTESNDVVKPIHNKAMPVMLMTAKDVEQWVNGTLEQALKLQKPALDKAVVVVDRKNER